MGVFESGYAQMILERCMEQSTACVEGTRVRMIDAWPLINHEIYATADNGNNAPWAWQGMNFEGIMITITVVFGVAGCEYT
jgi:hypothetical protein